MTKCIDDCSELAMIVKDRDQRTTPGCQHASVRGSLMQALFNDESLERIDNFDVMALFLVFERRKGNYFK